MIWGMREKRLAWKKDGSERRGVRTRTAIGDHVFGEIFVEHADGERRQRLRQL